MDNRIAGPLGGVVSHLLLFLAFHYFGEPEIVILIFKLYFALASVLFGILLGVGIAKFKDDLETLQS